jgi:hypothetical protein
MILRRFAEHNNPNCCAVCISARGELHKFQRDRDRPKNWRARNKVAAATAMLHQHQPTRVCVFLKRALAIIIELNS